MARVTHVKSAQQRYATKPVIDPTTGKQKRTPVISKRTGEQKVSKRGPVFMDVTERDLTRPLAPLSCDFSGCDITGGKILPGQSYNHVTPKSGPYGGYQRSRHAEHPSWKPWDLSNAWWARIAQATDSFDVSAAESADDVTSALEDVASAIRDLAEESRETAQNVEEGFGHPTSTSEEAEQRADDLDGWADEIENVDVPEQDDFLAEVECEDCDGTGKIESIVSGESAESDVTECETCAGAGTYTPEDLTDDQMDEWREAVQDACEIVNESPV